MAYSNFYARFYTGMQKIRESVAVVWKFLPSRIYLGVILFLNLVLWFQAIAIFQRLNGDFLILHYNIDFGVDLLGVPQKIFYFPIAALLVFLLNFILVTLFSRHRDAKILFHLFFSGTIIFNIFTSLALFAIYLINFQ